MMVHVSLFQHVFLTSRLIAASTLIGLCVLASQAAAQTLGYHGKITTTEFGSEIPIVAVDPNSPAEEMDLRPGDVILKINGISPLNQQQVRETLAARGGEVTLEVRRNLRGFVPLQPPGLPPIGPGGLGPIGVFGIRAEGQRVPNTNEPYLRITAVSPGSIADANGIRVGYVIWRIDGRSVSSFEDFKAAWSRPGNQVEMEIQPGNNQPRKFIHINR